MQQRWALVCAALAVFFAMPAAAESVDRLEGKSVSIARNEPTKAGVRFKSSLSSTI